MSAVRKTARVIKKIASRNRNKHWFCTYGHLMHRLVDLYYAVHPDEIAEIPVLQRTSRKLVAQQNRFHGPGYEFKAIGKKLDLVMWFSVHKIEEGFFKFLKKSGRLRQPTPRAKSASNVLMRESKRRGSRLSRRSSATGVKQHKKHLSALVEEKEGFVASGGEEQLSKVSPGIQLSALNTPPAQQRFETSGSRDSKKDSKVVRNENNLRADGVKASSANALRKTDSGLSVGQVGVVSRAGSRRTQM